MNFCDTEIPAIIITRESTPKRDKISGFLIFLIIQKRKERKSKSAITTAEKYWAVGKLASKPKTIEKTSNIPRKLDRLPFIPVRARECF
ncbi:MAG: hypothetical protein LBD73_02975 [Deferribacteraceae bacterium]|nr:hypothetical protein [Deferribacteraceae bacterium]